MSERIKEGDAAGTTFHVGDSYIWSEIYYLDSPTDYREYLPQDGAIAPAARGELVMLGSSDPSIPRTLGILLLVFAIICLTLGYFVHTVFENL